MATWLDKMTSVAADLHLSKQDRSPIHPFRLTILVDRTKSLDDVIAIARVEGRKKLRCNVRILDLERESEGRFVVSVVPKYQGSDVGAQSGMEAEQRNF